MLTIYIGITRSVASGKIEFLPLPSARMCLFLLLSFPYLYKRNKDESHVKHVTILHNYIIIGDATVIWLSLYIIPIYGKFTRVCYDSSWKLTIFLFTARVANLSV